MSSIPQDTIGNWDPAQLMRYVRDQLTQDPVPMASNGTVDELIVARKFTVTDEIAFNGTAASTATAGSGAAVPVAVAGYIRILDNQGQVRVIPYFNP